MTAFAIPLCMIRDGALRQSYGISLILKAHIIFEEGDFMTPEAFLLGLFCRRENVLQAVKKDKGYPFLSKRKGHTGDFVCLQGAT